MDKAFRFLRNSIFREKNLRIGKWTENLQTGKSRENSRNETENRIP